MGIPRACSVCCFFHVLVLVCSLCQILYVGSVVAQTAQLTVDASPQNAQTIPGNMFGIFFEEINHAGAGGLWAELVSNRGFEAGGSNTPSNIDPWSIIGDESNIIVATDRSSCFASNPIALRMEVLCGASGTNACPSGGVGIYNPGYWGMNIERTKVYRVTMYIRSSDSVELTVSLTSSEGPQNLASHTIMGDREDFAEWTKVEFDLQSNYINTNSRLQLTTTKSGIIWFDQVSLMPSDTYMGHGFRKDLASMLANLKPRFLKFPGGNYVMGNYLINAFRWSETVGPWEERPGHFNDAWAYWTDDGLGFFEFLQDVVNGIEFARGDPETAWGSVRAAMGHPEPFQLYYVSIGNQECSKYYYKDNYVKFYSAIKASYPDIKIISSCDRSAISPVNPADLYDVHIIIFPVEVTSAMLQVYTSSGDMFSKSRMFDNTARDGPKVLALLLLPQLSSLQLAGTLIAALAEAAFLIGLERNSDMVEMASCAPLFVNDNDQRWNPDAIVFNSWQHYGCPNYWMLHFFKDSSGAALHPSTIQLPNYDQLVTSAITWKNPHDGNTYLKIKVVNFGSKAVNLNISVTGLETDIQTFGSIKTVLTSGWLRDENSFQQPDKVVPAASPITNAGKQMGVVLNSYSLTSFDLLLDSDQTVPVSVSSLHSSV
ncbi:unnamed protein product [Miscanthus lutarioriparius]|uniref:non-reducing end alpha-L-arabinofuranosidase n=1 Tax=Miscanthus lutarioriparius TaxID=422564 RepID=A0A811MUN5_9POAL|nr:unnamed protein product [Miscanthus lutarioriparius]